ncbi:hypothetical protein MKX54_14190 [Alkalihalobacillus sp. FSL R5-0424]
MITYSQILILFLIFLFSIPVGLLLRVIYYSPKETKFSLLRIRKVLIVAICIPFWEYERILTKRKDVVRKIKKDRELTQKKRDKLLKRINSKKWLAYRLAWKSITNINHVVSLALYVCKSYEEEYGTEAFIESKKVSRKDFKNPLKNRKFEIENDTNKLLFR